MHAPDPPVDDRPVPEPDVPVDDRPTPATTPAGSRKHLRRRLQRRTSRRIIPILITAAYGVLIGSFVGGNPLGASPDEPAHYIRALGVASGEIRGSPAVYSAQDMPNAQYRQWINQTARQFTLPAPLAPGDLACYRFEPQRPASCLQRQQAPGPAVQRSYVGTYQPFMYLPPGLLARLGRSPLSALLLGRLGDGAIAVALIALAAYALLSEDAPQWAVAGLLVAISPMVVFLGASLSPNGSEVAAGVCFFSALMGLARGDDARRVLWLALAAGGAILAVSRSTGPVLIAIEVGFVLAILGPRQAWRRCREGGRLAAGALAVVMLAGLAGMGWELAFQPHPPRLNLTARSVASLAGAWPTWLKQQIGVLGWLDARLPTLAYDAWIVLIGILIGLALLVGTRRQRVLVGAAVVGVAGFNIALAFLVLNTGLPYQGRYGLALSVVVPLYAGEVIRDGHLRLGRAVPLRLGLWVAIVAASVQGTAWYTNARRYAVGVNGPVWFAGGGQWVPPVGWLVWGLLALVGGGLLVGAGAASSSVARARPSWLRGVES